MLTIKIITKYPCGFFGKSTESNVVGCVEKNRILTVDRVDVDTLNDHWVVMLDKEEFYPVPFFHKPTDWENGGVNIAVYVENERGKTVHMVRSEYFQGNEPIHEGVK